MEKLTHKIVPEKFRQTKDNVKCLFVYPLSACCGNLGVLYVSDIENGNSKYLACVSAAHYPPVVEFMLKGLSYPIALSFYEGFLYIAECRLTLSHLGRGAIPPSWETFLNNSKTAQDIKMKIFKFNLTPMGVILDIITILINLQCCHGSLFLECVAE